MPKALKTCQQSNKSPNLVTLIIPHILEPWQGRRLRRISSLVKSSLLYNWVFYIKTENVFQKQIFTNWYLVFYLLPMKTFFYWRQAFKQFQLLLSNNMSDIEASNATDSPHKIKPSPASSCYIHGHLQDGSLRH